MNKILLDLPNKIITPRLILRHPQAGDGQEVFNAISDGYEDVVKWMNQPEKIPPIEYFEAEVRRSHALWILRSDIRFVITDKETDNIIGIGLYPPCQANWNIPSFGIMYFLAKTYQRKGYATEAVNALIRFAFKHLKARKIEIKCDEENVKSIAIPERLGMQLEASQKGLWPRNDKEGLATVRTYAIFNTEILPELEVHYG
ncbi:MAG: GNAT family N-acetyltransferase [Alphaproteobacteria bacterium]